MFNSHNVLSACLRASRRLGIIALLTSMPVGSGASSAAPLAEMGSERRASTLVLLLALHGLPRADTKTKVSEMLDEAKGRSPLGRTELAGPVTLPAATASFSPKGFDPLPLDIMGLDPSLYGMWHRVDLGR